MAKRDLSQVVALRLAKKDVRKLDRLATQTHRGRADVLRCLLHQAEVTGHPDLIFIPAALVGVPGARTADEKDAVGVG